MNDRQTGSLLPPSVDEWLPGKPLARFIVEGIDGLDPGRTSGAYRGSGSASYHPAVLPGIQVEPMLKKIGALPAALGKAEHLLADTGYFGADNVAACEKAGVEPGKRDGPTAASPAVERADAPKTPTPVEAMAHKQKTPAGRALCALRKQTPEPVFGVIKSVLGFRQFSMRGLEKARGEWSLATMAWNLKRMFALKAV